MRDIHKNIPVLFEPYPWEIVETEYSEKNNKTNEAIFTIGNGYLGVRGYFEEGYYGSTSETEPSTLINGIYEYFDYHHIWRRPGFPGRYHAIINQANPYVIEIYVDGEKITLSGTVTEYRRVLNMKDGTLTREFKYATKSGKIVSLRFSRFASQSDRHMLLGKVSIESDKDADIEIKTRLEIPGTHSGAKEEIGGAEGNVYAPLFHNHSEGAMHIGYQTKISNFKIACGIKESLDTACHIDFNNKPGALENIYRFALKSGEKANFEKYIAFATNRDLPNYKHVVIKKVLAAAQAGYNELLQSSKKAIDKFWESADVIIDGDVLVQQGVRFSIFQIFQSTGKDGITNISANGLSGTGYSGHTFWDTEVFMMPMYLYTQPEIEKSLLMYRYNILPKARERAREMDDVGALYSWNSINGEECGHVFEAVTAQYHINNDVFYAIYRYYEATEDRDFLINYGAEILFEISKCMAHRGNFIPLKGNKFCINVICGPDEYNPVVDNNMYTNVLTQKQLYFTLDVVKMLKENYPKKYDELREKCGIDDSEIDLWRRAADNMYIPYSKELDIYMQDDNFIYKDPIDIDSIPKEKLPLLTNLHPLNLWRYQVIKQADIVLLTFIYSEYFTREERKKIFDFYEPKTIHDSSLSASIHAIVACDIGYGDEAYGYLCQAARMDLDNVNRNTFYGLHAACMGATWMMIANGYGGLRIYNNMLHFRPFIEDKWNEYSYRILFRSSLLEIRVNKNETIYKLCSGPGLTIEHYDETIEITGKAVIPHKER